jgi:Asp-tRNA(Asn)/Glu-tRNA(Gln) amidotransferase A subunit family amidase
VAAYLGTAIGSHGGSALVTSAPARRISGPPRLLFLRTLGWAETDTASRAALTSLLTRLRRQGVEITDRQERTVAALEAGLDAHVGHFADILAYEMQWPYGEYVRRHGTRAVGPRIRELLAQAAGVSQRAYARRLRERHRWRETVNRWLGRYDAIITLASSGPAPLGLRQTGSRTFLAYASWLGLPSLAVPLLRVEPGLPVGVQLIGRAGEDRALCQLGHWLTQTAQGRPT